MPRTPPARTAGQRPFIAVVAGVVLVIGATAVADRVPVQPDASAGPSDDTLVVPSPEPGRTAQVVGPVQGAEVAAYLDDRTAALLDAPEDVDTAVVSFTDVLTPGDAAALVGSSVEVRALLYRLPLPQATPRTVRVGPADDPAAALAADLGGRLEDLRADRDATLDLLDSGTVEDDEFLADYERRVAELDAAIAAASAGRVVHAVVVRGDLGALRALVDAVGVRLVDPAPPGTDVSLSVFAGLLPTDTGTVTAGRAG